MTRNSVLRILGVDPGFVRTGWGLIDIDGNVLSFVACGTIGPKSRDVAERLLLLRQGLMAVIAEHRPSTAAIESMFVNVNAQSSLKLAYARSVALCLLAEQSIPIAEYAPNTVKKSVVGMGHAKKDQVQHMVKALLRRVPAAGHDAYDALAIAICHSSNQGKRAGEQL